MFDLLAQTATAASVNWTLEIAKMITPAIIVLLGLWAWHRQKRSEPKYYLNQKRVDGLMKAWSLLAYITEAENPKAVMVWEKNAGGTIYYIRPKQANEFIITLSEIFYGGGYGLLLGKKIKELVFEYRNQIYGFLLKSKNEQVEGERIKIQNEELSKRIKEICAELNNELKNELKEIRK